mmetsp:Transcript_7834/g.13860  ORF Transcript_7834/g.13860 Transcript_7834/m.13860 type:complete len:675 (-) Transcript_7834:1080-3104(-)
MNTNDQFTSAAGAMPVEPGTLPGGIVRNMKRNASAMRAEKIMKRMERELKRVRRSLVDSIKTHRKIQIKASLSLLGRASTWIELEQSEQTKSWAWEKDILLAILSCKHNSGGLPQKITEAAWEKYLKKSSGSKKRKLALDPDLFIARSRRWEFDDLSIESLARWFREFESLYEMVGHCEPGLLLAMVTIIRSRPEVFTIIFADAKCQWKEVAVAYFETVAGPVSSSESYICKELCMDPDVMLLVVKKDSSGLEVLVRAESKNLLSDVKFARTAAKILKAKVQDHLKFFSREVRANTHVVTRFCVGNGKSYRYVDFSLRSSIEGLARIACDTYPDALLAAVPGIMQQKLVQDEHFIIRLFDQIGTGSDESDCRPLPSFFNILAPSLKRDRDVCLAAFKSGIIGVDKVRNLWQYRSFQKELMKSHRFILNLLKYQSQREEVKTTLAFGHPHAEDIPVCRCCDRAPCHDHDECQQKALVFSALEADWKLSLKALTDGLLKVEDVPSRWSRHQTFWQNAIKTNAVLWKSCPFANEVEFARSMFLESSRLDLHRAIMKSFPSLSSDRKFWRRFLVKKKMKVSVKKKMEAYVAFDKFASKAAVGEDKATMLLALSLNEKFYDLIEEGSSLKNDRQIYWRLSLRLKGNESYFKCQIVSGTPIVTLLPRPWNMCRKKISMKF